jgi:hypothetical protein
LESLCPQRFVIFRASARITGYSPAMRVFGEPEFESCTC